jgi:hypothetical protein
MEKVAAAPWFDAAQWGVMTDGFQQLLREANPERARQLLRLPLHELVRHWRRHWLTLLHDSAPAALDGRDADIRVPEVRRIILHAARARWQPLAKVRPFLSRTFSTRRHPLVWTVTELTTQNDLIIEGRVMRHCVARYARLCRAGLCAIFRLRCHRPPDNGRPEVLRACTIEVHAATRRVLQIKSRRNSPPDEWTLAVIREWAEASRLKMQRR